MTSCFLFPFRLASLSSRFFFFFFLSFLSCVRLFLSDTSRIGFAYFNEIASWSVRPTPCASGKEGRDSHTESVIGQGGGGRALGRIRMEVRAGVLLRRTPSGQGTADAKRGVRRSAAGSASIGLRQEERGCVVVVIGAVDVSRRKG